MLVYGVSTAFVCSFPYKTSFTFYQMMSTLNDPRGKNYWKHCGKRRNGIFRLSPIFFLMTFLATFILLFVNTFNLDKSKIMLFDKNLTPWSQSFKRT